VYPVSTNKRKAINLKTEWNTQLGTKQTSKSDFTICSASCSCRKGDLWNFFTVLSLPCSQALSLHSCDSENTASFPEVP